MRINLATDFKTRTGSPDKDARQKNSCVEVKGDQATVRKRPSVNGGIPTGIGIAQGGIGVNIAGTPYFIGFWGDTLQTYTGGGTSWNNTTGYLIGDSVYIDFVTYWAITDNTNINPETPGTGTSSGAYNWSRTYVPKQTRYRASSMGATSSSKEGAANNLFLVWPYNSCATKAMPAGTWQTFSHVTDMNIYAFQWIDSVPYNCTNQINQGIVLFDTLVIVP